jgi:hypothetical protein
MLRRSAIAFLVMMSGATATVASGAQPPAGTATAGTAIPAGFTVHATNGWRARVIAGQNPKSSIGGVVLMLRRGGEQATYATKAEVTETSIEASLGALGEIDVHSVPAGGTITERPSCGGKPVTFATGRWEGTIRFRGEEDFTSIDTTNGIAAIKPFLDVLCFGEVDEGIGGHSPGALLELTRRHATEDLALSVRKNKRVGTTRLSAELSERDGAVSIDRGLRAVASSRAFDFEIPPGRATVEPPAPFSGALRLVRRPGSRPSVSGDLTIDFPGRVDVPVLGKGRVRASLVRAVLNPSHPF